MSWSLTGTICRMPLYNWRAQRTLAFCFFNVITHIQTDEQNRNLLINHLLVSGDFLCIKQFVAGGLLWRWDQERKHETESQDEMIGLINYIFNSCCSPGLSLCSVLVQASMKVWAMTDREASPTSVTWTSKMNEGFSKCYPEPERQTEETNTQSHILFFFFFFADASY